MSSKKAISEEILKTEERIRQLSASTAVLSPGDKVRFGCFDDNDVGSDLDDWDGDDVVQPKQGGFDRGFCRKREVCTSGSNVIELTPDKMFFVNFLEEQKVSAQAKEMLLTAGVDSKETLMSLLPRDIEGFALPLGQKRLIQRIVKEIHADKSGTQPGSQESMNGLGGSEMQQLVREAHPQAEGSGALVTDFFLYVNSLK